MVAQPALVATHTGPIGTIHPPRDIRNIIETTAEYVARYGFDFLCKLLAREWRNPYFKFLHPSDPFHAFYRHRLSEHRRQIETGIADPGSTKSRISNEEFRAPKEKKVLVPPPADQYTVRLLEGITGEELDIIKLTAQFVARNGKTFMENLMNRAEVGLPQFHFLRPTHSMYTFFTSLADTYSKVLMPEKGITNKLKIYSRDLTVVLERCLNRLEWEKSQEEEMQKADNVIEQERMKIAMIDWHDFIAVETIEFAEDEDEELPIPMIPDEIIQKSKMTVLEETKSLPMEITTEDQPKDMEVDELDASSSEPTGDDPPMRIVKNWKRPEERLLPERDPTKFVISPITGELIPINEMAEHMRISLIDPKYKEQKDRMMAKIKETTLAADDEISRNIVGLARTRPDIFGTTEEEVSKAVKAEIEKKKEDQQYNNNPNLPGPVTGPTRPVIPTLRPLPPPPGLPRYLPPQMFLRPPPVPPQMVVPRAPVPPPPGSHYAVPVLPRQQQRSFVSEGPVPKRQRIDDVALVPEDQFVAMHPGVVHILVSVLDTEEGNLKGQVLEISIASLLETVSSLKEKIAGDLQVPANKQKISSSKAGFLKDNLSLAYYNIAPGETLSLSLRERGGRKK